MAVHSCGALNSGDTHTAQYRAAQNRQGSTAAEGMCHDTEGSTHRGQRRDTHCRPAQHSQHRQHMQHAAQWAQHTTACSTRSTPQHRQHTQHTTAHQLPGLAEGCVLWFAQFRAALDAAKHEFGSSELRADRELVLVALQQNGNAPHPVPTHTTAATELRAGTRVLTQACTQHRRTQQLRAPNRSRVCPGERLMQRHDRI
eukprot:TRINITY_DN4638_c0_g2_i19.p6 TRINITY_DN4638_c0_g2~~TRINITY_DN4638_c0_g2_i19.p6  ORF type:complete len:200 (-),score=54.80 TRINITY_DN4638_c0_g2_i19:174-773(-)